MENASREGLNLDADKERLLIAQWVLERNLGWIAAAEVKVGVIVALDTAMLGALGAALSASDATSRTAWTILFTVGAATALVAGIFCAAMAVVPRVNGPAKSLVFFVRIASFKQAEYVDEFRDATTRELLDDWSAQIHRNAEIACGKFSWVRKAMMWSFLAVLPWFSALVTVMT